MFAERLKEERARLKMSQTNFAEGCGVKKNAQIKYEKNERNPDSVYLEKAHSMGVDISYLITGVRTQPIELPSDEAFLLDSFRSLNAEQKKMALQLMLGGFERLKNDDDNTGSNNTGSNNVDSNNKNSNNTNSNNENSNNVDSNNTGSNNTNSNNSNVLNSFNTQSGFTELPFIWACAVCGAMAWLLGAVASWKAATDVMVSMSFGSIALLLWVVSVVMAVFGYHAGKKKFDEVQAMG